MSSEEGFFENSIFLGMGINKEDDIKAMRGALKGVEELGPYNINKLLMVFRAARAELNLFKYKPHHHDADFFLPANFSNPEIENLFEVYFGILAKQHSQGNIEVSSMRIEQRNDRSRCYLLFGDKSRDGYHQTILDLKERVKQSLEEQK